MDKDITVTLLKSENVEDDNMLIEHLIKSSKEYLNENELDAAKFFAERALELDPKNNEAKYLLEKYSGLLREKSIE